MPSTALKEWQTVRLRRLVEVDTQCDASFGLKPIPDLADENLRGYVMLLSAHFQGFCRELHTECVQAFSNAAPANLRPAIQIQCLAARELDGANPRMESLRKDFDRFNLDLAVALSADPANALRGTHLGHLIQWRNYVAHHKTKVPVHGGPFVLATIRAWRDSCDGLAVELDRVMYHRLHAITGLPPW